MAAERRLHGVAPFPVKGPQPFQMRGVIAGVDKTGAPPLADAVGMQVGRLLEPHQVGMHIGGGHDVTDPQAGNAGLGKGAHVHPAIALAQAGAKRGAVDRLVDQFPVGFVFQQGRAGFAQDLGDRGAGRFVVADAGRILERRDEVQQGGPVAQQDLTELLGIDAVGRQGQFLKASPEQSERLQGRQIARRFHRHRRAGVDVELGNQIDALLRAGRDQHLFRPAAQPQSGQLAGDGRAQFRFAVGGAVLAQLGRQVAQIQQRHGVAGRQAAGKRDDVGFLGQGQQLPNQGAGQAVDAFGEHARGFRVISV